VVPEPGWLSISTAGFASFNQARPPGHLVKELVQNSFDAIGAGPGTVALDYGMVGNDFIVECRDSGEGMRDLSAIRVVYLTFKKDSHLKRGRFGRGFKEVLSVARAAIVVSGTNEMQFIVEEGQQVTRSVTLAEAIPGTLVRMALAWPEETVAAFDQYFATFVVPTNIELTLNGHRVPHRPASHTIECGLPTEVYHTESHSWRKPKRQTRIELIEAKLGEPTFIYEMGIPVASAEWSTPFHINVLQRVPMNPNRDALASGYAKAVHAQALPVLLPTLDQEAATADWVGAAGVMCEESVQQQLLVKAFGETAVRSVPTVGKRDFDDSAQRGGATIVKTGQMSAGFRQMAKDHLPSAKQHVEQAHAALVQQVSNATFQPDNVGIEQVDARIKWVERQGGSAHVQRCLGFAVWLCQQLVDSVPGAQSPVTGDLALGRVPTLMGDGGFQTFAAHWSDQNRLTLALDTDCYWQTPLGAETLSILVHEAAHAQNMHHGRGFHEEVERLAGVAAATMFSHASYIRTTWPELLGPSLRVITPSDQELHRSPLGQRILART
jgi:hypothetical protein